MLAKDIMRRKVVTVPNWMTLQELVKVFQEAGISGAPVVDERGSVLGVVSQTDLVMARRESSVGVPLYHREIDGAAEALGIHFEECDQTLAEQIMTPGAISFSEDTPVEKLAGTMLERHIHRVLIIRDNRLVGIVTTMDLLRALVTLVRKGTTRRGHPSRHPSTPRAKNRERSS